MVDASPVVFEAVATADGQRVMRVRLNAEKSLNALSQAMIDALQPALDEWAADPAVAAIFLEGTGEKAFCAGGDVVSLYHDMKQRPLGEPAPVAEHFFTTEYRLDHLVHTYPKPIVCWADGIVMGGGVGLLAGCSHGILTERSRLAMPEMPLGLFPDVGGTYFLNRMPGRTGYFLGLTGEHVFGTDIFALGLGNYMIQSDQREAVVDALAAASWGTDERDRHETASRVLGDLWRAKDATGETPFMDRYARIQELTDHATPGAVMAAIQSAAESEEWLQSAAKGFKRACPVSLAVFDRQYRGGRHLSLTECFRRELCIAVQSSRRPDFREGVRALLVDKDRSPAWSVPSLAEVSDDVVDAHFELPADYSTDPLADL
ncbi:enoyl-CoA hydratase/isomerase family protein [Aquisalimonas asiatica]|uniref:3-hydroxyisobutyryl-CoA hydrolase n=1 Tax=Aquisalimonas asiatica TaxID=406100 RepID=A0A1H8UVP9_9GAMM|nr:enoyl-CoA hydratase/isomerase family protein [Aquisalimonas asiatica]SEP06658.1 Enoyl-CoA hydratase/carnithine racemase [Aquisalimonas asiatica]